MASTPHDPPPPPYAPHVVDDTSSVDCKGSTVDSEEKRMQEYQKVIEKHEINVFFATKMRKLEQYRICYLVDDSSSMSTALAPQSPYAKPMRRWDEARDIVMTTIDISSIMNPKGVDIYFLNRPTLRGVKSTEDDKRMLMDEFKKDPAGYTPLTDALRRLFAEQKSFLIEGKILLAILTDGQPTTSTGVLDTQGFTRLLQYERPSPEKLPITFVACTDDEKSVEYLNVIDDVIPYVDVSDDFYSERKQIQTVQGTSFPFSHGDYVVKCLLGPIDSELDKLDEVRIVEKKSVPPVPIKAPKYSLAPGPMVYSSPSTPSLPSCSLPPLPSCSISSLPSTYSTPPPTYSQPPPTPVRTKKQKPKQTQCVVS